MLAAATAYGMARRSIGGAQLNSASPRRTGLVTAAIASSRRTARPLRRREPITSLRPSTSKTPKTPKTPPRPTSTTRSPRAIAPPARSTPTGSRPAGTTCAPSTCARSTICSRRPTSRRSTSAPARSRSSRPGSSTAGARSSSAADPRAPHRPPARLARVLARAAVVVVERVGAPRASALPREADAAYAAGADGDAAPQRLALSARVERRRSDAR